MKWKHFLIGGAFVGAFSLGAYAAPLHESQANTNGISVGKNLATVQTANESITPAQGQDNFTCPMTGTAMGNGAGMGKLFAGTMPKTIAEALGMTVDELQAARAGGKSVADLAKEKGIKLGDLTDKMITERKSQLEQLVKDGKITQEQMDTMLNNMKTMMEQAIERDTIGPMNGRGGRMGNGHGGNWSGNNTNQQPTASVSGV